MYIRQRIQILDKLVPGIMYGRKVEGLAAKSDVLADGLAPLAGSMFGSVSGIPHPFKSPTSHGILRYLVHSTCAPIKQAFSWWRTDSVKYKQRIASHVVFATLQSYDATNTCLCSFGVFKRRAGL